MPIQSARGAFYQVARSASRQPCLGRALQRAQQTERRAGSVAALHIAGDAQPELGRDLGIGPRTVGPARGLDAVKSDQRAELVVGRLGVEPARQQQRAGELGGVARRAGDPRQRCAPPPRNPG